MSSRPKLEGYRLRRALSMYADADGMTVAEVAVQFGVSARVLHRYAARAGIRRLDWKVGYRNEAVQEVTEQKSIEPRCCGDE